MINSRSDENDATREYRRTHTSYAQAQAASPPLITSIMAAIRKTPRACMTIRIELHSTACAISLAGDVLAFGESTDLAEVVAWLNKRGVKVE